MIWVLTDSSVHTSTHSPRSSARKPAQLHSVRRSRSRFIAAKTNPVALQRHVEHAVRVGVRRRRFLDRAAFDFLSSVSTAQEVLAIVSSEPPAPVLYQRVVEVVQVARVANAVRTAAARARREMSPLKSLPSVSASKPDGP